MQRDLTVPTRRVQDMSHRGEGKAVLVISQFSHNLSASLTTQTQRRTGSSGKWSTLAPCMQHAAESRQYLRSVRLPMWERSHRRQRHTQLRKPTGLVACMTASMCLIASIASRLFRFGSYLPRAWQATFSSFVCSSSGLSRLDDLSGWDQ